MISVIVPVYNTEKYLKKCINSIIGQTYKDLEILLIDDGSLDSSGDICKEYESKDCRVRYVKKENGGQASARNVGLDMCTGEWISFVDSDDWIEEKMFETMIKCSDEETDVIVCGWFRNHGFKQIEQQRPNTISYYNNEKLIKAFITTPYITSSMCNKIYRKRLWEGTRFPLLKAREDAATIYKILTKSQKAVHIGESFYVQYVRPGSTERCVFNENKLVSLEIAKEKKFFLKNHYPQLDKETELIVALAIKNLMVEILSTFSYGKNKVVYNKLTEELREELNNIRNEEVKLSGEYLECKKASNNLVMFRIKCFIDGVKNKLVDTVKRIKKY